MNTYLTSTVEALGWALIHCLWQGTALALGLAVLLRVLKNARAPLRYGVATVAFGLFVAAFGVTFLVCWPEGKAAPVPLTAALESTKPPVPQTSAPVPAATAAPSAPVTAAPVTGAVPPAMSAPKPPVTIPLSERFRAQLPRAVAFWALGVLLFSARFLAGWVRLKRWVAQAVPVADQAWNERFAALSAALKISKPVRFLVSAARTAPAVVGWLKPVVLVPAGIFSGLTAAQLEAILAHELAHVRRHDYLVNLLQNIVETLFFYHPAAWWISRQMRNERENCCDDLAARMSGGALSYAKALTALEEMRGAAPALALAASGGSLLARIRRLLGVKEQKPFAWPLGVLLIGIAAFLFSLTIAKAAPPEDSAPKPAEVTDGTYRSYCVHQNGDVKFVFLSKYGFTVNKGTGPEHAALDFAKPKHVISFSPAANSADTRFSPAPKSDDTLEVFFEGNLRFQYDLTRSRVFFVDFDVHGFASIVHQIPVKLEPVTSPEGLTKASAKVAAWLTAADDAQKWEYTRVKVPDSKYYKGKPVDPNDQSIIWGDANEAGLRLGIGGMPQHTEIAAGQNLPVKQYIRNDGPETLRLSPTGFFNEGIEAELRNAAGAKFPLKRGYPWPMFFIRIKLDPGEFAELQSSPLQTILANKDGSPSTGQRAYTSSLVLSPGDYTLHLSHRVGQFSGKPVNANLGDPRLAPGLGEWRGTLQATPISFQLKGPLVATRKPGSVAELGKRYRLQFQKGQIVLSHPAPGLQRTDTWVVDADGNWPTPGGTWKTADPAGDYVAAWDEGATRLWYVDGTGIQRLDIAEKFADAGHWTMAEAGGDLANMPEGVRKALGLPAKKAVSPGPGASAPAIRGVSLQGVPATDDKSRLADLYQPDPANAGRFVLKGDVFDMPLDGEKDQPVLIVPKGRGVFYIELKGQTYGPVSGNAAVDLGLTHLMHRKLAEEPNREGLLLVEKMIRKGSPPIRAMACRLAGELKEPKNVFDYDGIFSAGIDYSIEDEAAYTAEDSMNLQNVRTLLFAAREKWEKKRVELPESAYTPGEKITAENPDILWSEPDKDGMRLGVSGLKATRSIAIGKTIPVEIFLRNDGGTAVKFSWDPCLNASLHAWLADETEEKHPAEYRFSRGLPHYRHCRLEPGQLLKIIPAELEFFKTPGEIRTAGHKKGFEYNPRFAVPPGTYSLHLDYRIGSPDFAAPATTQGPEKVEWTGLLSTKPMALSVVER